MKPLSKRMRDVLAGVAAGTVSPAGRDASGSKVGTLRALQERRLISWTGPYGYTAKRPQLLEAGRAELDRIHAGSTP